MRNYVIAKYIRLSIEDTKTDSLSIPNQRLLLDRYIDSLDIVDAEVLEFVDNGFSGTNFERPSVQRLLDLVRASKIDCIMVKDFSRFGRNILEMGYFIEMVFPLFHTRFISVSDGFDSDEHKGDTGGMDVAFKFLMHEYYSHDLSRKEKSAKYAKMKRGEYQSEVCSYGYRKGKNGRLAIDEDAAAIVRLIFEAALTMNSSTDICKMLYERRIPTPGEYRKANGIGFHDVSRSLGIWQGSAVLRILGDERYTGTYIMGKRAVTEVGGHRVRQKDESEWFKIPDHHPAIVSKELFEQVQAKMRRFKCPKKPREYVLRTKVFCGCCRHAMQRVLRKAPVFICRYMRVDEGAECYGLEIGEQELERLLYEIITKYAQMIMGADHLSDLPGSEFQVRRQAEVQKRIEQCDGAKRLLYERFVLKELTAVEYKSEKARIEAELSNLRHALDTIKAETAVASAATSTDNELRGLARTSLEAGTLTRALVDLLTERIYVYPGNRVEIEWKVSGFGSMLTEETLVR